MCLILRYINEDKITIYVEHPVPLEPPVAEAPAPPMPLMLTAKEKKKIRKQRREEREKERQVCTHWLPCCPSLLIVYMFSAFQGITPCCAGLDLHNKVQNSKASVS